MSTKPAAANLPRWATGGSAIITEPVSGKKDIGWEDGDYAPAEEFNWLHYWTYKWLEYLSDAAFQGQSTYRSVNEDTFVPLIVGLDPSNGTRRTTLDHNGFRGGWVCEGQENWRLTVGSTDPCGWITPDIVGSATRSYNGPTALFPVRRALLTTGTTNPSSIRIRSDEVVYMDADRTFFMEGIAMMSFSSTRGDTRWGLWDQTTGYGWWFRLRPSDNTDIECFTVGAAGTTDEYDTNVAIVSTTIYRLRLEVVGANNHDGANGLVRFFINGTLVREYNFSDPVLGQTCEMMAYVSNTDATSVITNIGPIRWGYNQLATPDNV